MNLAPDQMLDNLIQINMLQFGSKTIWNGSFHHICCSRTTEATIPLWSPLQLLNPGRGEGCVLPQGWWLIGIAHSENLGCPKQKGLGFKFNPVEWRWWNSCQPSLSANELDLGVLTVCQVRSGLLLCLGGNK